MACSRVETWVAASNESGFCSYEPFYYTLICFLIDFYQFYPVILCSNVSGHLSSFALMLYRTIFIPQEHCQRGLYTSEHIL